MKSSKKLQCYCCEQLATTRDHIPPLCFFPKKKSLPSGSPDYRKNLITVPSCSEHNNSRSNDDEYTAVVIATNSHSKAAYSIFTAKWVPALLRREGSLLRKILSTAEAVKVVSRKNNILIPYDTLAISYEVNRIYSVVEFTARGLYYYESGGQKKWTKKCIVQSPNFLTNDLRKPGFYYDLNEINKCFIYGEKRSKLNLSKKGSQPDVFFYQIFKADNGDTLIRMVFYEDFIFFARLTTEENTLNPIILYR